MPARIIKGVKDLGSKTLDFTTCFQGTRCLPPVIVTTWDILFASLNSISALTKKTVDEDQERKGITLTDRGNTYLFKPSVLGCTQSTSVAPLVPRLTWRRHTTGLLHDTTSPVPTAPSSFSGLLVAPKHGTSFRLLTKTLLFLVPTDRVETRNWDPYLTLHQERPVSTGIFDRTSERNDPSVRVVRGSWSPGTGAGGHDGLSPLRVCPNRQNSTTTGSETLTGGLYVYHNGQRALQRVRRESARVVLSGGGSTSTPLTPRRLSSTGLCPVNPKVGPDSSTLRTRLSSLGVVVSTTVPAPTGDPSRTGNLGVRRADSLPLLPAKCQSCDLG